MDIDELTPDISAIPYEHRFAAAGLITSKGNRLARIGANLSNPLTKKEVKGLMTALSYFDIALFLLKPFDPNYLTTLNWKCLALESLGQFADARRAYQDLLNIVAQAEGPNTENVYVDLAKGQIKKLTGKDNEPLPDYSRPTMAEFDDPEFCVWAEQFCYLLRDGKFKDAYNYLSAEFGNQLSQAELKQRWNSMLLESTEDPNITLEHFELAAKNSKNKKIGWCYFSVTCEEANEAITVEVGNSKSGGFNIIGLEFGRP